MTCGKCKRCECSGEPYDEQKALDRAGDEVAKAIDQEALLYAGEMMSDKGYQLGSYDKPGWMETKSRWDAVFAQLEKDRKDEQL